MHFINTSQIIILITFISALVTNPVFAMPARNITGGAIAARQDRDLPIVGFPPGPGKTIKPPITTTKTMKPSPTLCGPNMKRQEGDVTGLKIVPVCD